MFPKTGNKNRVTMHETTHADCAMAIGSALRSELGSTHQAAKTVMRWTGASNRSAKNWIGGSQIPSGWYLILLARHSPSVMTTVMVLARRDGIVLGIDLRSLQLSLDGAAIAIGKALQHQ
jgi:hypothetical protein